MMKSPTDDPSGWEELLAGNAVCAVHLGLDVVVFASRFLELGKLRQNCTAQVRPCLKQIKERCLEMWLGW